MLREYYGETYPWMLEVSNHKEKYVRVQDKYDVYPISSYS